MVHWPEHVAPESPKMAARSFSQHEKVQVGVCDRVVAVVSISQCIKECLRTEMAGQIHLRWAGPHHAAKGLDRARPGATALRVTTMVSPALRSRPVLCSCTGAGYLLRHRVLALPKWSKHPEPPRFPSQNFSPHPPFAHDSFTLASSTGCGPSTLALRYLLSAFQSPRRWPTTNAPR